MAYKAKKRLTLAPDFAERVARVGLSMREFIKRAGVSYATVQALQNPSQHPERVGGMYPATAWKLANTYAEITSTTPEAAYSALIVEAADAAQDGAAQDLGSPKAKAARLVTA